jgi:hypothetical protein
MIYIPDINENDYLTGDGPLTKKITQKIENCLVDGDLFIINTGTTGRKKCPSIPTSRKLSKLGFNNWVLKKYNSYLDNIL